jgi:hypothetical protein
LKHDHALVRRVESQARRRFAFGYPPRKPGDTSLGDAINWEWIIECALKCGASKNIVIVSRDGDYGVVHDSAVILNDFLSAEFKERVSQKRRIVLTNRLTDAVKLLNEKVEEADVKEEQDIIEEEAEVSLQAKEVSLNEALAAWAKTMEELKKNLTKFSQAPDALRNTLDSISQIPPPIKPKI